MKTGRKKRVPTSRATKIKPAAKVTKTSGASRKNSLATRPKARARPVAKSKPRASEVEMPEMIDAPQTVNGLDRPERDLGWPASVVPAIAFAQWQLWMGMGRSMRSLWLPHLR